MNIQPCICCGSVESEVFLRPIDYISGETFTVVRCVCCGLVYVHPQPLAEDLKRYYPLAHQQAEPAAYERMDARSRIKLVRKFCGTKIGRMLDVGCGKGLLLMGLRQQGWEVFGTELSEISSAYACGQGLSVLNASVDDASFEPESFDLITLFHVLEHLPQPGETLKTLKTLLRPDGILIVEVPNIGSWYARVFGDDWFHLDVPRHLYHFDARTLPKLLDVVGFRVTDVCTRNVQYDSFGAVQSLLNRILGRTRTNLLNNFNTGQTTFQELWNHPRRFGNLGALALSQLTLAVGFPLFAVSNLALAPWVDGGTLRLVARKSD